ncbi:MAG: acyl-CoA thioesterase [Deltaproteobacteria bacterium]|uniref:acyl-CoA thioesterase n=1 Tax=Desulfobacula sp. TaxID=2593537 RepID=UPI00198F4F08|nr:acyl-CoA thioesterase [Candidatus Desulfobacula maris]MBL6995561.1 acyl-CoA thioesterase [Desulfobacula sp.]
MLMTLRAPRVEKPIEAVLDDGICVIENISTSGGFLKTGHNIPKKKFNITLKLMGRKTIGIKCEPQWENESGVGFKILDIENSKENFFNEYIENQFQAFKLYGANRIFTSEIMVTLKDTNVFGNVYFSNYIEYQGAIREKFLLASVPDLHEMLAKTHVRLVTIDTYNKFISNAYFGDILLLELTTSDINAATCKLNITFKNKATGKLVGKGYQRFCVVSSKGKVMRLPEALLGPLDFYQEIEK